MARALLLATLAVAMLAMPVARAQESDAGSAGADGADGAQDSSMSPEERRAATTASVLAAIPPAHRDVVFAHRFPSNEDSIIERGSVFNSLFGLVNEAESDVLLYSAAGSLNLATDFSVAIHNFTLIGYNQTLAPEGEGSFLYRQRMPGVEAGQYQLALTAFYKVDGEAQTVFATTFFNETITVTEEDFSIFSFEVLFNIATGLTVAGTIYYYLNRELNNKTTRTNIVKQSFEHVDNDAWFDESASSRKSRKSSKKKSQ